MRTRRARTASWPRTSPDNGDLLRVAYWTDVQQKLLRNEVPELRIYPRSAKLTPDESVTPRVYYP